MAEAVHCECWCVVKPKAQRSNYALHNLTEIHVMKFQRDHENALIKIIFSIRTLLRTRYEQVMAIHMVMFTDEERQLR